MNKNFNNIIHFLRFLCAVFIFGFIYTRIDNFIGFMNASNDAMHLMLRYFLVEGLGGFIAMFAGLLIIDMRFRMIAGPIILFVSLVAYIVIYGIKDLTSGSIIVMLAFLTGISFLAFGLCTAIVLISKVPEIWKRNQKPLPAVKIKKMPRISLLFTFLGLLSVPAAYITITLSSFITLGISIWALWLVLILPWRPLFLIIGIGLTPLVAIGAVISSIFSIFFTKPGLIGAVKITLDDKPELKKLITGVCVNVGTKFPDNVILVSSPSFFVTQAPMRCYDTSVDGRTLALGATLINSLSEDELKAVLAHEFAHFSGNDTLYSSYVAPVYGILGSVMGRLNMNGVGKGSAKVSAQSVMAFLLNVPKSFINMFMMYFASIDRMLCRNREFRADWIAALLYGNKSFGNGLEKVVQISGYYYDHGSEAGFENDNYFKTFAKFAENDILKLESYSKKAMENREEGAYDTHPTLSARLMALPETAMQDNRVKNEKILNELNKDEVRLSKSFRESIKLYKKNNEIALKNDILNKSQSELVTAMVGNCADLRKMNKEYLRQTIGVLLMGYDPSNEAKTQVEKIIAKINYDTQKFRLLQRGAALRIKLYEDMNQPVAANKIWKKYYDMGISSGFQKASSVEMQDVEQYLQDVIKSLATQTQDTAQI